MTAFNYDPIRATAISLINKFGRQTPCVPLRTVETSPPDATKPWRRGDPTVYEFNFLGVVTDIDDPTSDANKKIIAPGDLFETAAEGFPSVTCGDPTLLDRIETDGQTYQIIFPKALKPNDKTIMYTLICKAWPGIQPQPGAYGP